MPWHLKCLDIKCLRPLYDLSLFDLSIARTALRALNYITFKKNIAGGIAPNPTRGSALDSDCTTFLCPDRFTALSASSLLYYYVLSFLKCIIYSWNFEGIWNSSIKTTFYSVAVKLFVSQVDLIQPVLVDAVISYCLFPIP